MIENIQPFHVVGGHMGFFNQISITGWMTHHLKSLVAFCKLVVSFKLQLK